MTKFLLMILIGAGAVLIFLEYVEAQERHRARLMEKWREKSDDGRNDYSH